MAITDITLPPNNRVENDPDHVPDHNEIVDALQAIIDQLTSPITLESSAAGNIGLIVKLAPFATAAAFRVTDSAGTVLLNVDDTGQIVAGNTWAVAGMLKAICRNNTTPAIKVKAASGQTANMMVVQDSNGDAIMEIEADGTVNAPNIGTVPGSSPTVTYSPLLVLDAAEAVPSSTLAGTVVLRRPA